MKASSTSKNKVQGKRGRPPANLNGELCAKEKLIETAIRLFYRFGINSVGVDKIIAEAGVAKMTFFKHFPTKRDLILEFLKARCTQFISWFQNGVEANHSPEKSKLQTAVEVVELWFKHPDFRGCAFINTTAETGPEFNEEKLLCVNHKEILCSVLEQYAKEDGYQDPKKVAFQLVVAIDGATIRAQMDGYDSGVAALRSLTDLILAEK